MGLCGAGVLCCLVVLKREFNSQKNLENRSTRDESSTIATIESGGVPDAVQTNSGFITLQGWEERFLEKGPAPEVVAGLRPFGPAALAMISGYLEHPRYSNKAAFTLVMLGKESLPYLIKALTSESKLARLEVAGAIGMSRTDASEAIPALVSCLKAEDPGIRSNAIASLQSIPGDASILVPALNDCLVDSDANVRANAATVIQKYGIAAMPAISNLLYIARFDSDSHVRTRASESAKIISPALVGKD